MDDFVVFVDDELEFLDGGEFVCCRICHEAEYESCREFESPCACSGTAKYAHRDCIQRWCDEKGNTVCEICLQKYEGGYTAAEKKVQQIDIEVTIRGSIEIPRREHPTQNTETMGINEGGLVDGEHSPCISPVDKSASFCRSVALILTILLLTRHLCDVLKGGAEHYPFTLLTVLMLRVSGIVIPMYMVMKGISAIQNSIRRNHHHQNCEDRGDVLIDRDEGDASV